METAAPEELKDTVEPLASPAGKAASRVLNLPHESQLRVRAYIIGHARINMYVNLSHAWFKMAD